LEGHAVAVDLGLAPSEAGRRVFVQLERELLAYRDLDGAAVILFAKNRFHTRCRLPARGRQPVESNIVRSSDPGLTDSAGRVRRPVRPCLPSPGTGTGRRRA